MKICYVLLDKSNATSDIFYFTIEDNGRNTLNMSYSCALTPNPTVAHDFGIICPKAPRWLDLSFNGFLK